MGRLKKVDLSSARLNDSGVFYKLKVVFAAFVGAAFISILLGPVIYFSFPSMQVIYINLVSSSLLN